MKKYLSFITMSFVVLALCSVACNRVEEEESTSPYEYPATADVIRNAVKDVDGNKYDAVRIGDQVWMAQNLRTSRYSDGTEIPMCGEELYMTTPLRYCPASSENTVYSYGYLYNWSAATRGESTTIAGAGGQSDVQGVCPEGWHLPSKMEWNQLTDYIGSQEIYGGFVAKALASTQGWQVDTLFHESGSVDEDPKTNNATGFSAFPAGYGPYIQGYGKAAWFWTSTENDDFPDPAAYGISFGSGRAIVFEGVSPIELAFSVRCVRNLD